MFRQKISSKAHARIGTLALIASAGPASELPTLRAHVQIKRDRSLPQVAAVRRAPSMSFGEDDVYEFGEAETRAVIVVDPVERKQAVLEKRKAASHGRIPLETGRIRRLAARLSVALPVETLRADSLVAGVKALTAALISPGSTRKIAVAVKQGCQSAPTN